MSQLQRTTQRTHVLTGIMFACVRTACAAAATIDGSYSSTVCKPVACCSAATASQRLHFALGYVLLSKKRCGRERSDPVTALSRTAAVWLPVPSADGGDCSVLWWQAFGQRWQRRW